MSYEYEYEPIELRGYTYACSGKVEFTYVPGDKGDWGSQPYDSHAEDVNIILKEVLDEDDESVTDEAILKELRTALEKHYNNNQDILTDDWEETAMEVAASNRHDEYIERMNSEY
jgi:hypothetical protein